MTSRKLKVASYPRAVETGVLYSQSKNNWRKRAQFRQREEKRIEEKTMTFANESTEWKPYHSVLVGVIGGVGPAASARLYQNIVELKPASRDSDHVPVLIYNNPQIPNNNEAVTGKGPSSVPAMVYTAKMLEKAGATHIAIPCNTAHVFVDQVQCEVEPLQVLNMLDLAASNIRTILSKSSSKPLHRVGLIGTIGTIQSEVYQKAFEKIAGTLLG